MVYETTCKGRQPLPARLWTPRNVKHIMKDDLDLTVIEILKHISSVVFTGQRLNGAGLTREEARACLITDKCVTMSLAAGQYSEAIGYTEFNLKVPGVSDYDMDRLALLAEDDSNYSKRVPVALGTETLDSIMYAMKEAR